MIFNSRLVNFGTFSICRYQSQRSLHSSTTRSNFKIIRPISLRQGIDPSIQLRTVPPNIQRPPWYKDASMSPWDPVEIIADKNEIEGTRYACKIAKKALDFAKSLIKVNISTDDIDKELHNFILKQGAYPSPLNYGGFPKSICTSVNNIIAHGIPDFRKLEEGDIINIDITVYFDGFHGDTSATFEVGQVDDAGKRLISATKEALEKGISVCKPGAKYKEIGDKISKFSKSQDFSVVYQMSGHGIGRQFHQLPYILHHENDEPGEMKAGQIFTIEPSLCEGVPDGVLFPDGWTITTADWKRSAQFEHTVLITEDGVDVLTR